ncbi:MAG: RIP metalloprotease RseP [Myxococcales bacterium]|nr:RIP metalloprotease RseP [Myxococcales bacterium]
MTSLLAFIVLIGVLITAHELGHFIAAKLAGVKVEVFSIGFGGPIVKTVRGDTEYRIAWLPLGGYVRMMGALPGDEPPRPEDRGRGLFDKPPWIRVIIAAAGPAMNLILPLLIVTPFVTCSAQYDQVPGNRIGAVDQSMPAWQSGLREGDAIVAINGEPIEAFWQIKRAIDGYQPEQGALTIRVDRPGEGEQDFQVTPKAVPQTNPVLGFSSTDYLIGYQPAFLSADVAVADPNGALAAAGVQTFDRVIAIDGQPVERYLDVQHKLTALDPGQSVKLRVQRDRPLEAQFPFLVAQDEIELTFTARGRGEAAQLGMRHASTCVQSVDPEGPAARVLQRGDCLVAIDGESQSLGAFLARRLDDRPEEEKMLTVLRDGAETLVAFKRQHEVVDDPFAGEVDRWPLGFTLLARQSMVAPDDVENNHRLAYGWYEARTKLAGEFEMTVRMIGGLFSRQVSASQLSGPLTIFYLAGESARAGLESFLNLMVLLSLSIGLFNLLPVPVLDGGQILVAAIEGITRRPLPMRVQTWLQNIGVALILALVLFALFNDAVRMWRVSGG